MENTILDQIDTRIIELAKSQHVISDKKEDYLTFTAHLSPEDISVKNNSALLQINIREEENSEEKLKASLELISQKFSAVNIFIDMDLAILAYSIIMPYIEKESLLDMVSRRKADWLKKHMKIITDITIPWSVVTSDDSHIQKTKNDNINEISNIVEHKIDTQENRDIIKSYLAKSSKITTAMYNQKVEKNDKAIARYLSESIATLLAVKSIKQNDFVYISSSQIPGYDKLIKGLPKHLTLSFLQTEKKIERLPTSTELNQNIRNIDMLGEISNNKSYLEKSIKYFPGNVYLQAPDTTNFFCNHQQAVSLGISDESFIIGKKTASFFNQEDTAAVELVAKEVTTTNATKIVYEPFIEQGERKPYISIKMPLQNKKNKTIGLIGFSMLMDDKNNAKDKIASSNAVNNILEGNNNTSENRENVKRTVENMPGHVFWQDIDGKVLGCNHYQANFLGFNYPHELIGKYPHEFLAKNNATEAEKDLEEIITTGKPIVKEEIYKSEDGFKAMESHKTPVKNKEDKVIGIIVISFDISKNKKNAIKLEEEKERLAISNIFKSQFIQDVENDLRDPFASLCSITELYANQEREPEKKQHLNQLVRCAKELLSYCDSLLDFNKNPSFTNNMHILSIKEIIYRIVSNLSVEMKIGDVKFDYEHDSSIPNQVLGDPYRLKCILHNLLGSAIKSGSTKLVSKVIAREKNHIKIEFLIANIAFNDVETEKFIEDLRGTITSDSGTYTSVIIPFNLNIEDRTEHRFTKTQKILIVENSGMTSKFLNSIISELGCVSSNVTTAKNAMEIVKKQQFDVLMIDIDLPDISGYDLAYQIRKKYKNTIKIFMMTAQKSKSDQELNKKLDITATFVKPVKVSDISSIILNDVKHEML